MHENRVEFQVSGDYAMFADPVTRVGGEKLSYQIPTYEALKGILQSIYFKPTLTWIIDAVRVMEPIQMETKGVRPVGYGGGNDLSYYTYLKKVRYQVRAHFEWNLNRPELEADRNENKHHNIAKRMVARGGRRDIFLGTRECQGYVEPCDFDKGQEESFYSAIDELAFGFMYHGITYADEAVLEEDRGKMTVRFWRPVMRNGVICFLRPEECTEKRHIKDMEMKVFGDKNFTGLAEFPQEEAYEWEVSEEKVSEWEVSEEKVSEWEVSEWEVSEEEGSEEEVSEGEISEEEGSEEVFCVVNLPGGEVTE